MAFIKQKERSRLKCAFCDNHPVAYWHLGTSDLKVCSTCAVDLLPRLIADAIAADGGVDDVRFVNRLHDALQRIENAFWYGAFHAILQEKRRC